MKYFFLLFSLFSFSINAMEIANNFSKQNHPLLKAREAVKKSFGSQSGNYTYCGALVSNKAWDNTILIYKDQDEEFFVQYDPSSKIVSLLAEISDFSTPSQKPTKMVKKIRFLDNF